MGSIHNGVWPTMLTPFTREGTVDYAGIEKLLSFYEERKVDGIFALCQSSEMFFLSLEERKRIIRFISEKIPRNIQVIVSGHTADSLEDQVREAKEIFYPGVEAYVVLPNRFASENESDDVLLQRMETFANQVPDIPLGIYECPYPYKRLLTPKVIHWCIRSGRFLFIKDTCCDLAQIKEKLDTLSGTNIKLFNANSATLLESLRMGAHGYSGIMANIHPEFYGWLCHHFKEDPQKAEQVQQFIGTCSMAEYQYYPVNAKYSLTLQGVPIEISSRIQNADHFSERCKMEMGQLTQLSFLARKWFAI